MRWLYITIGLVWGSAGADEAEPLMIATGDFSPYTSSEIATGGFLTEITMRAFELAQVSANEIYLPWARGYLGTQKQHFDATFPYMKTAEREAVFLYSEPLFPMAVTVFVRSENAYLFSRPEDFVGYTWCLPRAYTTAALMPFLKKGLMSLVRASDDQACMEMVKRKRATAYPIDLLMGEELIKQQPELFEEMVNLNWAVNKNYYYLIVSKNHPRGPQLISAFNRGLQQLKSSPEWQQILHSHGIDERHLLGLQQTPIIKPN